MATTSKDGSRRETCPLPCGEAEMRREYFDPVVLRRREYWRASRVPAAAVIPAPGVSMIYAAFEMSVVEVFLCVVV